jgi:hypothetical protein
MRFGEELDQAALRLCRRVIRIRALDDHPGLHASAFEACRYGQHQRLLVIRTLRFARSIEGGAAQDIGQARRTDPDVHPLSLHVDA